MVTIEIGSADGRGFGAGPYDRLAGLEHRGTCLELRAHVGRLSAGGDTDANDRNGGDQRDTYNFEVGRSASSMHARVIHHPPPFANSRPLGHTSASNFRKPGICQRTN